MEPFIMLLLVAGGVYKRRWKCVMTLDMFYLQSFNKWLPFQSVQTIYIFLVLFLSFRAAWYLLDLYFLPSPQHKVLSLTLGQLIGATVLTVFRQV